MTSLRPPAFFAGLARLGTVALIPFPDMSMLVAVVGSLSPVMLMPKSSLSGAAEISEVPGPDAPLVLRFFGGDAMVRFSLPPLFVVADALVAGAGAVGTPTARVPGGSKREVPARFLAGTAVSFAAVGA